MKHIVAVSGSPGAGKTTVSQLICSNFSYSLLNVGDLLAAQLAGADTRLDRRSIGPRFLSQFGVDGYRETIRKHASPGRVFDGVRLFTGVAVLRGEWPLIHIFKDGPPNANASRAEYADELRVLKRDADYVLPWTTTADIDLTERLIAALRS